MNKIVMLCNSLLLFAPLVFSQNVGIGTSIPNASAALEVQSTNKGMLVPRIALTATNIASPVTSPADALLIYNTATDGSGNNAVTPGFYYWSIATSQWIAISGAKTNSGNTGFGTWGDCLTNGIISEYNPVAANDGAANDNMGFSVSIAGNYAIVGASGDDIGANADQGSAYIFYYNGNNWIQQQKLVASDGVANDRFGYNVSIYGSYAMVCSVLDDVGVNTDQGSVYLFSYNGSSWVQQQKLTASDGLANDFFGGKISMSGNYAIIGANSDDIGANTNQGSAYVFFYNGSSWVQQQKLTASDGAAGDAFGSGVSISGNYIVVGAGLDDAGTNTDQGSAYVFFYNGSSWVQQQKVTASDGAGGDSFGVDVSIAGNYIIIGAYFDNIGTNNSQGSAYIFFYDGSTWVEQPKFTAPDGAAVDNFGIHVSISGNYAMIGAYIDDIGTNTDQGSVYVFQNINGIWNYLQKITRPNGNPTDDFGISCSLDNGHFVIGAFGVANSRGMAFFGKIN